MEPNVRPYPEGISWSWLACDREGQLALFGTSGKGPVPVQTLDSNYPEGVEQRIRELPAMSDVRRVTAWVDTEVPERGVFLYNWNDGDGAYELVLAPYRPSILDQLPNDLAEAARSVRFIQIDFADAWKIDVRAHMSCRDAQP